MIKVRRRLSAPLKKNGPFISVQCPIANFEHATMTISISLHAPPMEAAVGMKINIVQQLQGLRNGFFCAQSKGEVGERIKNPNQFLCQSANLIVISRTQEQGPNVHRMVIKNCFVGTADFSAAFQGFRILFNIQNSVVFHD